MWQSKLKLQKKSNFAVRIVYNIDGDWSADLVQFTFAKCKSYVSNNVWLWVLLYRISFVHSRDYYTSKKLMCSSAVCECCLTFSLLLVKYSSLFVGHNSIKLWHSTSFTCVGVCGQVSNNKYIMSNQTFKIKLANKHFK